VKTIRLPTEAHVTADLVPDFELTHGRALWVLSRMGLAAGVPPDTLNHYVKSVRKLGVPFAYGTSIGGSGKPVRYSFYHMMELALALTLRVYGTLPEPVLKGLVRSRHDLYALYRRAYLEFASGLGAPVEVSAGKRAGFVMSGVYLDLDIRFAGGKVLEFRLPRVLSPFEALRAFAKAEIPARTHPPLNLSQLAITLARCATLPLPARRGPSARARTRRHASGRR
jgi:hypothetical protein